MIFSAGIEEYAMTLGMLIGFLGLIISLVFARKEIFSALKKAGLKRVHLIWAVAIVLVFLSIGIFVIQPSQLLFFDDAIYQAMAVNLLHTGQAWMCNYGTPTNCFLGQIYHEPIGTSFDLAVGFFVLGVSRNAAFMTGLAVSAIAVIVTFFASLLLLKNVRAALLSELLLAVSPIVLIWAMPTNSDIPTLAYSMIALFTTLIFIYKKNIRTFAPVLFSIILVSYMKINSLAFILLLFIMYLILDNEDIVKSIKDNYQLLNSNLFKINVMILVFLFVLAMVPELGYTYSQFTSGDYGSQGANLQNSCNNGSSATANSSFSVQNFNYNVCANINFWLDQYQGQDIIQPILFTLFAIAGMAFMMLYKRREFIAIALWLVVTFIIYTSFYAGAATYGVDWRFMLSMIAQVCILGGFGLIMMVDNVSIFLKKRIKRKISTIKLAVLAFSVFIILYQTYLLFPQLGIPPSKILQAPDARFYENFIYNQSASLNPACLIFSYDPTLFIINNRTATQMSDIYDSSKFANFSAQYPCLIVDYGYWCYTPNNLCTNLNSQFNLTTIANATFKQFGRTYSLYYVGKN